MLFARQNLIPIRYPGPPNDAQSSESTKLSPSRIPSMKSICDTGMFFTVIIGLEVKFVGGHGVVIDKPPDMRTPWHTCPAPQLTGSTTVVYSVSLTKVSALTSIESGSTV